MPSETVRSRFQKVMRGEKPQDRLPMLEWATWWDLTIKRFKSEGLPADVDLKPYFGLDVDVQHWFCSDLYNLPPKSTGDTAEGTVWVDCLADYEKILPYLYPEHCNFDAQAWARDVAPRHERGEVITWFSVEGFFWWPRMLFGVTNHLLAYYDHPDALHAMNRNQLQYMRQCIDKICAVDKPDFMTFGEDMSYNHGPMISKKLFTEFMAPYYREIIPEIKARGIIPIIDSDGDVEPLIPWFEEVGLEGILPLERMAGVDVNRIRANHPEWKMIGGFDKTVMHCGEAAIRAEFERLMPAMKSGRFVPSVDHQTPPGVSLSDYHLYLELFAEYARLAVS